MENNNLQQFYPQIASEWHPTLNGLDKPEQYSYGSHKRVWWFGKCGHEWEAPIKARVAYKTGCPYCSGNKVLKGFNDLATVYPKLAAEWHPEMNGNVGPDEVISGSSKKFFWLCKKGHYWDATISSRVTGRGCRYCSGNAVWVGYNDLQFVNPELAKEWHPTLNGDLTPRDVTYGSTRRVWWRGKCGHEWEERIKVRRRFGCPICSGKRVLKGFNDIATAFPYLREEWDYEKNDPNIPEMYTKGCNKKFGWICPLGHKYEMAIDVRTRGQNCPICASELKTSFPEQAFFYYVKKSFPDAKSRDNSLGIELDVFVPSLSVAVEYDGEQWHNNREKEKRKNEKCNSLGIHLIRIKEQVGTKEDRDVSYVYRRDNYSSNSLNEAIKETLRLLGVDNNASIDVDEDRSEIYSLFVTSIKKNNLVQLFPDLVQEWNYEKNEGLLPEQFAAYSNRSVWWKGKCGHEWNADIESRSYGQGCPICSGKRVQIGENDFASHYPELVDEWDYEKNKPIVPTEVTHHSHKKVWWIGKCGHTWRASIEDRAYGSGCPVCAGKKVQSGFNDLLTRNPLLAEQWDYEKNIGLLPSEVTLYSNRTAWWKCNQGHSYEKRIADKAQMGLKCPICKKRKSVY